MSTRTVTVPLGDRSYPVVVEPGGYAGLSERLDEASGAERVALVTEETVGPLWADAVRDVLGDREVVDVVLPAGEASKTIATWAACLDELLAGGLDRRTPVLALGGGVLGDVAGFAAATAMRGVPFVQLPTTLLAMVDSSVGGKTAVNHPLGKNLVGAFHQPVLVYAALATLGTLPESERIAGLGEVVKTALLGDADLLARLERDAGALRRGEPSALVPVVARCVEIKAEVVGRDERESGWRVVLNAGHTLGHAWEHSLGYGSLRHGEAVALGLVAETAWAVRAGHCADPDLPGRLTALLERLGLPVEPPEVSAERLIAAMGLDKKVRGDTLVVPVPVHAGKFELVQLPRPQWSDLLPETA